MILAEISADGWVMIIGAISLGLLQIIGSVLAWLRSHMMQLSTEANARAVAKEVEGVRHSAAMAAAKADDANKTIKAATEKTDEKLDKLTEVTDDIHKLSNSQYGTSLRLTAELSRWKANQEDNPEYARAAEEAEKMYREHMASQAKVDAKNK